MQLLGTASEPAFSLTFRRSLQGAAAEASLVVERVWVRDLPAELTAVLVASDLQGFCDSPQGPVLLGIALADAMARYCRSRQLAKAQVGVLLAGDLFVSDDPAPRASGVGDVRAVWRAFAAGAAFVAGVAGNHDSFGNGDADLRAFAREPGMALLDVGTAGLSSHVECCGLRIAGVSGIVGNPTRPWRKHPDTFVEAVATAIATHPDVLLLHQNPALPGVRRDEQTRITQLLASAASGVVVFGHAFSPAPRITLGRCELLATEGRAFWLERTP